MLPEGLHAQRGSRSIIAKDLYLYVAADAVDALTTSLGPRDPLSRTETESTLEARKD